MKYGNPLLAKRLVKMSTPVSVTNNVCSNCADNNPSTVTAVQLSGQHLSRQLPAISNQTIMLKKVRR